MTLLLKYDIINTNTVSRPFVLVRRTSIEKGKRRQLNSEYMAIRKTKKPEIDPADVVNDVEYVDGPFWWVFWTTLILWGLPIMILWLVIDLPFPHSMLWGSLTFAVVYFGVLYKFLWRFTTADEIIVVQKVFARAKAGTNSKQLNDTTTIPEGVRALAPGFNTLWLEVQFGEPIDISTATLCELTLELPDKNGEYFKVEFTGPITAVAGKYAARHHFIDLAASKSFYSGVFEKAMARGFSNETCNDIQGNPEAFSNKYLTNLLGGQGQTVKLEVQNGYNAGTPYINRITPLKSTLEIRQTKEKSKRLNDAIATSIAAGVPPAQAAIVAIAASGGNVDMSQVNLSGAAGNAVAALAGQGGQGNQGNQGGGNRRNRRRGGQGGNQQNQGGGQPNQGGGNQPNQGGNQGATP